MINVKPGDIGLAAKRSGFYPKAVRFFTQSNYSHVFLVSHEYYGELSIIEADLKVQVVPFQKEYIEKDADSYKIYRPIKAKEEDIHNSLGQVYKTKAGNIYAFFQIPWFAFRSIMRFFGKEVHKNWYQAENEDICSETPLFHLLNLGPEYYEAFKHLSPNETSPQDIAEVVESRSDLFELVYERK